MSTIHPAAPPDRTLPRWLWLILGGLGGVLLLGGALGWILRGSAMLMDMADFFCL
jgi:hypothetical protein